MRENFCKLYKVKTIKSFLANWKLNPMNLLKGPPPPHTHTSDVSIFKGGGGGFHVQYRGNVLLWPKSDESKKCLVLFYLFTLCLPLSAEHFLTRLYVLGLSSLSNNFTQHFFSLLT
jgi:hypothetical protein